MNQSNTQGFRGYRASPTAGQGRDYKGRAFSVMYKEKAKFAVGVFKPNSTSYAIGLKPSEAYNPLYSAARLKHSKDRGQLRAFGYKQVKCSKCGAIIKTG